MISAHQNKKMISKCSGTHKGDSTKFNFTNFSLSLHTSFGENFRSSERANSIFPTLSDPKGIKLRSQLAP